MAGSAQFEVRTASSAWAAVLAGVYYALLALTIISGLLAGYFLLCLFLMLKAEE